MEYVDEKIFFNSKNGEYVVNGQTWMVGEHYKLHKLLGCGSFSTVCLATSKISGEKVALKRIPNVLQSENNAKKVLRELCILRRISHPNVISIKHAFIMPSDNGPWKYINGKFEPCSIDLYLALEYCIGGDFSKLIGQLTENEVRDLMFQLLTAIDYLHTQNIWHRDLKSANILLTIESGEKIVKIADFGSARSAFCQISHDDIEDDVINKKMKNLNHIDHFSPLTHLVCTPCYRAPEVVMSRGGYSSALDMWSLGCIFAELLQRTVYPGSATTPKLRVGPLFCAEPSYPTPKEGEFFAMGNENSTARKELQCLFDVIGTPSWSCIEAVQSKEWRCYLKDLPLISSSLYKRFIHAGNAAVDLLSRLLTFDPERRCRAREALMHEYFVLPGLTNKLDFIRELKNFNMELAQSSSNDDDDNDNDNDNTDDECLSDSPKYYEVHNICKALAILEDDVMQICSSNKACSKIRMLLEKECEDLAQQQTRIIGAQLSGRYRFKKFIKSKSQDWSRLLCQGLIVDPNTDPTLNAEEMAYGRLPHVADCYKANLDVEKHLAIGRQGEWTVTSGCGPIMTERSWGVSMLPPGYEDKSLNKSSLHYIIKSQQMR